jgi:hypothetical protein
MPVCVCVYVCIVFVSESESESVSCAHASLLQEELTAKVLHHLQTSFLHWDDMVSGMDMPLLASTADIWTEEPVASIVFHSVNHSLKLAAHRSCII